MLTNFIKFVELTDDPLVLNNIIKRLYATDLEDALKAFDDNINTAITYTHNEIFNKAVGTLDGNTNFYRDVRNTMLTIVTAKLAELPDSEMN